MSVNQTPPNPLDDAPQGSSTLTRTSGGASGTVSDSGTAGHGEMKISRVLRVQLAPLSDTAWTDLRALAREGAQFCNLLLAGFYVEAVGYGRPEGQSDFRRFKGRLSGDVRVALAREAFTAWKRHGSKIRSGAQRLALFDADRALVCRAEHMSKERRQRHCWIAEREGGVLWLSAPLIGKAHGSRFESALVVDARTDDYVGPVLAGLAAGAIRLLKVSIVFERPVRKVFALLTYEKRIVAPQPGSATATLGPLEADGTLWLRFEDPRRNINLTGDVARLIHMKRHFAGVHRRLKARIRRSGPGHRHEYRRALVRAGSFGAWALGPLHAMAATVTAALERHGAGSLAVGPVEHQDLPMAAFLIRLGYRLEERGIALTRFDPAVTSTARAVVRPIEKARRSAMKQRTALDVLKDAAQQQRRTG